MTLPKPPLPRNCRSSNSHFTRDCPETPEMYMRSQVQALRVPVGQPGVMAHHPLPFHCSFQLPVDRALNYRI